jgi:hypothetical protein
LSKLVEVQRDEREMILKLHKDRIHFLRTDFDYTLTRLETVTRAYEEERQRWIDSRFRETEKVQALQARIDEQMVSRQQLVEELRNLRDEKEEPSNSEEVEKVQVYLGEDRVRGHAQEFRWQMRKGPLSFLIISMELDEISHYIETKHRKSQELRLQFEKYFISLPENAMPILRPMAWLVAAISWIYSQYISFLVSENIDPRVMDRPFSDTVYELFLAMYGTRQRTEQVLFDLLFTVKSTVDCGLGRISQFARFFGLFDPLPVKTLHFYLYVLSVLNHMNPGPLFPSLENGNIMLCGISAPIACAAGQQIFPKYATGRVLKFYNERLSKLANDGMMRFGGRNVAEFDQIIDYILATFVDECVKLEDILKDDLLKLKPLKVGSVGRVQALMFSLKRRIDPRILGSFVRELSLCWDLEVDHWLEVARKYHCFLPFTLERKDFMSHSNQDDMSKFPELEWEDHADLYQSMMNKVMDEDDQPSVKCLRTVKVKFDQALENKSFGKTFQQAQREFYERLYFVQLSGKKD